MTCYYLMELLGWEVSACRHRPGVWGLPLAPAARPARLPDTVFPSGALPRLLRSRYLLFMKLAALQLMQQKASKMENPTTLENGDPPSSEPKPEDPPGPEAGSEEEGGSASGLAKVKELAETIASDDGTGGAAVHGGSGEPGFCPGSWHLPAVACPSPERGRQMSARSRGRPGVAQPPPSDGGAGLPPSRPCLHSRPSEPRGDPQRVQGSGLHQLHSL